MPVDLPPPPDRPAWAPGRVIRIVVADDHAAFRHGLVGLLSAGDGFHVVAEAVNAGGALRAVLEHMPDVLLLDLSMPGDSSLEAIPAIRERAPGTAVVIVTMQDDPAFERRAHTLGAAGYVLKDDADGALVGAIHSILKSHTSPEG